MESPSTASEVGEDLIYLEADAIKMKLKGTSFGRKASKKSFIIQFFLHHSHDSWFKRIHLQSWYLQFQV